jgi:hypothetical protein
LFIFPVEVCKYCARAGEFHVAGDQRCRAEASATGARNRIFATGCNETNSREMLHSVAARPKERDAGKGGPPLRSE